MAHMDHTYGEFKSVTSRSQSSGHENLTVSFKRKMGVMGGGADRRVIIAEARIE